ncbi:MAG: hypothetical protein DMF61_24700 [Blastocatellia bacterium AA13]|nr:MAG: hypothetical protein DMF61_24700 [Blastocatellia bacterium AA13]
MIKVEERLMDPRMFFYMVLSIVMSGYDAVATMRHIGRGIAAEGNPLMDSLIRRNAVEFFLIKMAVTAVCLMLCYSFSHLRTARIGIQLTVALYSLVCLYHVGILILG